MFAPAASATGGAVAPRTFDGARIMRYRSVGTASPKFYIAKPQSLYLSIPYGAAPITQPSREDLRIVQIGVPNRRTGARRLRDERGVMGIVKGM